MPTGGVDVERKDTFSRVSFKIPQKYLRLLYLQYDTCRTTLALIFLDVVLFFLMSMSAFRFYRYSTPLFASINDDPLSLALVLYGTWYAVCIIFLTRGLFDRNENPF